MQFYILPNDVYIARNPRVASMAIAQAVMQTYYPLFTKNCLVPVDFYNICPITDTPKGTILLLVRDPVDRFLSALAGSEKDVNSAINDLTTAKLGANDHFAEQSQYAQVATNIFKYPDSLPDFLKAAGLSSPLPIVNETTVVKATLTPAQLIKVQQFYSNDNTLFINTTLSIA